MRILHTADWHLGKKLFQLDRIAEQRAVLDEIVNIIHQEDVDIILIAGDIYDVPNPSAEAIQLFYDTIMRMSEYGKRLVIAIAGNHDAAERIAAPDALAKANSIMLVGHPNTSFSRYTFSERFAITDATNGFVEITADGQEKLRLIITPYTNELRLKSYLGDDECAGLNEYLFNHWHQLAEQYMMANDGINILMTHLYMWSSDIHAPEEPEGEKPIKIGNASLIKTRNIPEVIHYTALGHLHRYQQADSDRAVYYCGSPLAYSFSEAGQQKYVQLIETHHHAITNIYKIPLTQGTRLIRKKVNSYDEAEDFVTQHGDAHIELTISTTEYLKANEVYHLQQLTDNILHIIPEIRLADVEIDDKVTVPEINKGDMMQQFCNYFQEKKGIQPNDDLLELFKDIMTQEDEE